MFSTDDTIVAIATPPGRGGIGVVRLSGPGAESIARRLVSLEKALTPRYATLATVQMLHPSGDVSEPGVNHAPASAIDQAVVTLFRAPHSYTGEDVVEISAHGSPVVLQVIVKSAVAAGARLAQPGEFTLRAFLRGRLDLPQAEAVADLIDSVTPQQAVVSFDQLQGTLTRAIAAIDGELFDLVAKLEASIDFPDEGYHFIDPVTIVESLAVVEQKLKALLESGRAGRLIREGRTVAIVGPPNVGKSSLFNALVGTSRAIVTPLPGTTRDLVSETVDVCGLRITLVDTAGVRETSDVVEGEGVARSLAAIQAADLVLCVSDLAASETEAALAQALAHHRSVLQVRNKCDLRGPSAPAGEWLYVSATRGDGLDQLKRSIASSLGWNFSGERPEIVNIRHLHLVQRALSSICSARTAIADSGGRLPEEFVLADLATARHSLEEITGARTSEDLLAHIFMRFCIGK